MRRILFISSFIILILHACGSIKYIEEGTNAILTLNVAAMPNDEFTGSYQFPSTGRFNKYPVNGYGNTYQVVTFYVNFMGNSCVSTYIGTYNRTKGLFTMDKMQKCADEKLLVIENVLLKRA